MPQFDSLRETKERIEGEILGRPGITGVGIGYKRVGAQRTDTLAIVVSVREKRDVAPSEAIPGIIDGFPTDVIEANPVLQSDGGTYDPLRGGISIGRAQVRSDGQSFNHGSLGSPVVDNDTGQTMLLSCFHVMCDTEGRQIEGDTILQPAVPEGGNADSAVGTLARWYSPADANFVDCAVAWQTARDEHCSVVEIGPIMGTFLIGDEKDIGTPVQKRGMVTGLTYGTIQLINYSVTVDYQEMGEITLYHQIGVEPDGGYSPFSRQGDSGSLLLNRDRQGGGDGIRGG